jgi:hypothetical protein
METKKENIKEVKLVLFLSRSCAHCKKLISENAEFIFDSGIEQIFSEEENFKNKYKKIHDFFLKTNPELAKYEYITPVLGIFDKNDNVVQVIPGYNLVKEQFDSIKNKVKVSE